jgi:hypothetical protein
MAAKNRSSRLVDKTEPVFAAAKRTGMSFFVQIFVRYPCHLFKNLKFPTGGKFLKFVVV